MLKLLEEAGWFPYYGKELPIELQDTHFQVALIRRYETKDYNRAEYLRVSDWGEYQYPLTGFAGRNGARWVGKVSRVGKLTGKGWKQRYGCVDGHYNYFVDTELRDEMLAAGLKGLRFHPLEWDEPEKAKADFWEIDPEYTMPPCLLPTIRLVNGHDADGNPEYMTTYDEGAHRWVEPQFRRSEVEAMGDFDLAWTREDLAFTKPNFGNHWLIVSQRCRQTFKKLGMRGVTYGICRLVD